MDPQSIKQRCLPYYYTICFTTRTIAHKYTKGRWPPHLKVSNSHNSFTLYTALCAIQLFVLSFGVELLDRSVIHLLFIRSFVCNMKRPSVKQSMKRQVSSNFQIYPGKTDDRPPPSETARALSELFAVQCHQWEPIRNGQLIRKYKKIPVHIETIEIPRSDLPR